MLRHICLKLGVHVIHLKHVIEDVSRPETGRIAQHRVGIISIVIDVDDIQILFIQRAIKVRVSNSKYALTYSSHGHGQLHLALDATSQLSVVGRVILAVFIVHRAFDLEKFSNLQPH